jgi:hypothetical protein
VNIRKGLTLVGRQYGVRNTPSPYDESLYASRRGLYRNEVSSFARRACPHGRKVHLSDDSGRMAEIADQQIKTRSGSIVQVAVERADANVLPTAIFQNDRARSDYRLG